EGARRSRGRGRRPARQAVPIGSRRRRWPALRRRARRGPRRQGPPRPRGRSGRSPPRRRRRTAQPWGGTTPPAGATRVPMRTMVGGMAYRPLRKPPAGAGRAHRPPRDGPTATVAGVVLTDPDRIVFRPLGLTKRQLAEYYETIASWALPHMAGRPTSVVRCPVGTPCAFEVHQ